MVCLCSLITAEVCRGSVCSTGLPALLQTVRQRFPSGSPPFCVAKSVVLTCTHTFSSYLTSPQRWTILTTPFERPSFLCDPLPGSSDFCLPLCLVLSRLSPAPVIGDPQGLTARSSVPLDDGPIHSSGLAGTFRLRTGPVAGSKPAPYS